MAARPLPFWAKPLLFALCALPLLHAAWRVYQGEAADPADYLTRESGWWALTLLLATLTITPLVKLGHWPQLMRLRRMLGLYAFAYASVHLAIYLLLSGGDLAIIGDDIMKSPYIVVGFSAWLLLLPLAITSTDGWMRRLKRRWSQLHRLIYPASMLAVIHFWWLTKSDMRQPLLFALLLGVLLVWRVWRRRVPGARSA
ncbi:protein-methionine-sulfoxide reductase heme-binding subunit MsrQ [Craterilacuibacter sp. RT1T]|uniref:sulfite oxidase heme-binding subunit YedZ n=1 Tax=Craterilacuibacter sp. RT1T TaxID=2942211 RepID=UPI0020BF4321|nr:protein-methionine-sulfoxide reductase heme-binding subunit MsrQ [Craterilacuibacter sp. RT1T]MCL6263774.1 sulfoxide reductase heme-binding subunit YedZ [Craterilacuibacter sp. RT1T]